MQSLYRIEKMVIPTNHYFYECLKLQRAMKTLYRFYIENSLCKLSKIIVFSMGNFVTLCREYLNSMFVFSYRLHQECVTEMEE